MKTIPQVRIELLELADTLNWNLPMQRKLKSLVKSLHRRKPIRRAATENVKFTPAVKAAIKRSARDNPGASYAVLGRQHRVSIGRVSEALAGRRQAS